MIIAHLAQIIFAAMLGTGTFLFAKRVAFVGRNINMGRDIDLSDRKAERWKTMARVAIGQSKMVARPVAGILHICVYVGFVIINIEMLEIVLDGLLGTHRIFSSLGPVCINCHLRNSCFCCSGGLRNISCQAKCPCDCKV